MFGDTFFGQEYFGGEYFGSASLAVGASTVTTVPVINSTANRMKRKLVDVATAGTFTLIPAVPNSYIHIWQALLVSTVAQSLEIHGTGGPTAAFGDTKTIVLPYSGVPWYSSDLGEALELTLGSSQQVSGPVFYTDSELKY